MSGGPESGTKVSYQALKSPHFGQDKGSEGRGASFSSIIGLRGSLFQEEQMYLSSTASE